MDNYVLDGKAPRKTTSREEFGKFMASDARIVAKTAIDGVMISTVFLGLDQSFGQCDPPLLFETMVFGGRHDQYQDRCSTWSEAETMHNHVVKMVEEE